MTSVEPGPIGLREQKKRLTRQQIADAAFDLFTAHGFDDVSVAAIAAAARVSEATVFNYFRTKEDLLFDRLDVFETALLDAVRRRPATESVATAFSSHLLRQHGLLASTDPEDSARLARVNRVIVESASLRARERQMYDEHARALAGMIAEETHAPADDIRPYVVANAVIGVQRALVDLVRAEILAGHAGPAVLRRVRRAARQAFAVLDSGLDAYPRSR